jgi:hypothetical protein
MSNQTLDMAGLRSTGMQRLRSGEYPESIARDLVREGLPPAEVESLFRDAAGKVRSGGVVRVVAGLVLLLLTALLVLGMSEAGYTVYGPGLLIGLFVLLNGFLKIKNSGEIARAARTTAR